MNSKNKTHFKKEPQDLDGFNSLGGGHLPAFARVQIGADNAPGEYTLRVTVSDRVAKRTKSFEQKFEVLNRGFGLIRLGVSFDPDGNLSAPAVGVPGQIFWVQCFAVAFERSGAKKEADVALEMQILDENGKSTVKKPITGEIKEVPKDAPIVPVGPVMIALNRAGKFTVKLKAMDRISKKSSELSFPLIVIEPRS